jgi:cation diffusion facilitator CzcD-associated flavoprotein CzcO
VTNLRWLEEEKVWEATLVHMAHGAGDLSAKERRERVEKDGERSVYLWRETVRAKIVASCVGGLVEPKDWPDHIPGRDTFKGEIFHSARWNYDVDLNNKDIIILGTGCSAAQFSTRLTKPPYNAKSVTQLMRSPPWVVPKAQPPFGPEVWGKWSATLFDRVPGVGRFFRTFVYIISELDYYTIFHNSPANQLARKKVEAKLIADMKSKVPEKYHEILTPDYGVGCKRRIFDEYWFKEMDDPKYNITTQPLNRVQERSVVLGPGRTYPPMSKTDSKAPTEEITLPADVIILANGFDLSTWLHPLHVQGRGGTVLQEEWDARGGPQAYLGAAMDGFPNFFIIFGPNTATGHSSVILAIENMINYSLKFMKPLLKGEIETVEVKKDAEIKWTKAIQEELKDTVWMTGGCHSWYFRADGWNATAYP